MTALLCGRLLLLLGAVAATSGRSSYGSHLEVGSAMIKRRSQNLNATTHKFDLASDAFHSQENILKDAHRLRGIDTTHKTDSKSNPSEVLEDPDSEEDLANRLKLPLEPDGQLDLRTIEQAMYACLMPYLLTQGTFYQKKLAKKTLEFRAQLRRGLPISQRGWRRHPELDVDPADKVNGVHGVVFTNDFNQAIVAIRGTDLPRKTRDCGDKSGCRSDLCADKKLWDIPWKIIDQGDLPWWCSNVSAVHDYPKLAADFVERALAALKDHEVLLVGHSLGAGLALITGAKIMREQKVPAGTTMQVVAVSPPPFASFFGHDQKLDKRFVVIYNELDPLFFATKDRGGFCGSTPMCYSMENTKTILKTTCHEKCIPGVLEGEKPAVFGTIWPAEKCDACWDGAHKLRPYLKMSSVPNQLAKCSSFFEE